jgi:hypothetical protein
MKHTFLFGDIVNYHSLIDGAVTSCGHKIRALDRLPSGEHVAWISGKSGCVSTRALSKNPYYCCTADFGLHDKNCQNRKECGE